MACTKVETNVRITVLGFPRLEVDNALARVFNLSTKLMF